MFLTFICIIIIGISLVFTTVMKIMEGDCENYENFKTNINENVSSIIGQINLSNCIDFVINPHYNK